MVSEKDIKIKGTTLDRRYKLTKEDYKQIKALKGLKTQKEIAEMFGVSQSTVAYRSKSLREQKEQKERIREAKNNWYHNKTQEEKAEMNKRWDSSKKDYRMKLLFLKELSRAY